MTSAPARSESRSSTGACSCSGRTHLYQRLANGGWGHARVTALYGAASLIGLLAARFGGEKPALVVLYLVALVAWVPLGGAAPRPVQETTSVDAAGH